MFEDIIHFWFGEADAGDNINELVLVDICVSILLYRCDDGTRCQNASMCICEIDLITRAF